MASTFVGIVVLLIVGFLGITIWSERLHPWLATIFGIGAALVIDLRRPRNRSHWPE